MIQNLQNKWMDSKTQRRQLDALQELNRGFGASFGQTITWKASSRAWKALPDVFEAMDVFDIRKEPQSVREEWGQPVWAGALARRLVERGVRLHVGSGGWDDHKDIEKGVSQEGAGHGLPRSALVRT